jgi:hypothetical protein
MSSSESLLSQFLTKEELSQELGRNARTLDRWEVLGTGPPRTRIGRKVLYRRTSLQKWLAAQERPSLSAVKFTQAPGMKERP